MTITEPHTRKLLDAALEHLALERAAACVIQVPETDPPLFVAVGPAPAVVKLLQADALASPELPDLDRLEALARATKSGRPSADVNLMLALDAETTLALIALARRAQPEGEAPQADCIDCPKCVGSSVVGEKRGIRCSYCEGRGYLPPAAQHAESGAQAAEVVDSVADFVDWMKKRGPLGAGGHPSRAFIAGHAYGVRAALAAQSQGAQAAQLQEQASTMLTQRKKIQALETALAAKAEAPAHETIVQQADQLVCTACGTSAQQAAAPGALGLLNADEMAALRRFDETCQDGEGYDVPKAMMQRLAAIGVVRRTSGSYYETTGFGMRVLDQLASSAPGTPEAPADMRAAADFIDKRAEQYLQDHASHEPDTGAVSFHYGEAGRDYHSMLVELADDLRQASKPAVCTVPPAGWQCARSAGHDGPCAAIQRAAQLDTAPVAPKGGA